MTLRRQATLYLPLPHCVQVESLRSRFNRAQFELIRAHVTLCREDEVLEWDELAARLSRMKTIEVTQEFGMPVRDGNLVLIPAIGSTESFDSLRHSLLAKDGSSPRKSEPHITLIHPRNGTCDDSVFNEITRESQPFAVVFRAVTFIEQLTSGPWRDLATFG